MSISSRPIRCLFILISVCLLLFPVVIALIEISNEVRWSNKQNEWKRKLSGPTEWQGMWLQTEGKFLVMQTLEKELLPMKIGLADAPNGPMSVCVVVNPYSMMASTFIDSDKDDLYDTLITHYEFPKIGIQRIAPPQEEVQKKVGFEEFPMSEKWTLSLSSAAELAELSEGNQLNKSIACLDKNCEIILIIQWRLENHEISSAESIKVHFSNSNQLLTIEP